MMISKVCSLPDKSKEMHLILNVLHLSDSNFV